MSTFLRRFEAIESRRAFQLCPRGTTGRLHVLRLRRHFQNGRMSQQATSTVQDYDRESEGAFTTNQTPISSPEHGEQRGEETSSEPHPTKPHIKEFTKELLTARTRAERGKEKYFGEGGPFVRRWLTESPSVLPAIGHGDALRGPGFSSSHKITNDLSDLNEALRMGNPHSILSSLMQLIHFDAGNYYHTEALGSIPPATFSEILQCLDPRNFVGNRYTTLHQDMHPREHNFLNLPPVDYYRFRALFISQISGIITARNRCTPLSIADHKFLLGCARATANRELAATVWRIMKDRRVQPDLECYNHYLCALCWSDNMHIFHKSHLRVIPWETKPRSQELPPRVLRGGHRVGRDGIKAQATEIFGDMARKGISGNEETFCLLMTALAREGDIPGVEMLLKRVWGIDVEAIVSSSQDGRKPRLQPLKTYNTDSPFYPSERLLYTLAHVYGTNNAIPTALNIIDYVSQQFSLTITLGVWKELLRWTYVLSATPWFRSKRPAKEGWLTGQLPFESMRSLWAIMISEPYNIKPTMAMYDLMIRNLITSGSIGKARELMEEARKLHKTAVQEHTSCKFLLAQCINQKGSPQERFRLSRDVQFTKLRWRRSVLYLRKWVSMLAKSMNREIANHNSYALPDFLREWSSFLPHKIQYDIDRQFVLIKTQYMRAARARKAQFKRLTLGSPISRRLRVRMAQSLRARSKLQRGNEQLILDGDSQPFAAEF